MAVRMAGNRRAVIALPLGVAGEHAGLRSGQRQPVLPVAITAFGLIQNKPAVRPLLGLERTDQQTGAEVDSASLALHAPLTQQWHTIALARAVRATRHGRFALLSLLPPTRCSDRHNNRGTTLGAGRWEIMPFESIRAARAHATFIFSDPLAPCSSRCYLKAIAPNTDSNQNCSHQYLDPRWRVHKLVREYHQAE